MHDGLQGVNCPSLICWSLWSSLTCWSFWPSLICWSFWPSLICWSLCHPCLGGNCVPTLHSVCVHGVEVDKHVSVMCIIRWAWPCRTSLTRLWLPSSFAKSWTCCKRSSMSSIMTSLSSGRETNRSALPWSMFSWIVPITSDISECSCLRFLMILCVVAGSMVMVTRSGSRSSLVTCFYTR